MIIKGLAVCYGIKREFQTLPIVNLPDDTLKVRRRMRVGKPMQVFVKTKRGTECHVAGPTGGKFEGMLESLELIGLYGFNVR